METGSKKRNNWKTQRPVDHVGNIATVNLSPKRRRLGTVEEERGVKGGVDIKKQRDGETRRKTDRFHPQSRHSLGGTPERERANGRQGLKKKV